MHISRFQVQHFKSFHDVVIHLNPTVNILTGLNNSGKTTLLEAMALWHECFTKLIRTAERAVAGRYQKGDYVLGNTQIKYFPFDEINSVRSPNFNDLFYKRDTSLSIRLAANFFDHEANSNIEIAFLISAASGGQRYNITLENFQSYNFTIFNRFFRYLPEPVGLSYATPVANIPPLEFFRTPPQVKDAITRRETNMVLRNRLYQLYRDPDLFQLLVNSLNYILYNYKREIVLFSRSDLQQDSHVRFFAQPFEQDIALLGSGTLQIIEILLNLYQPNARQKDFFLTLLDEPDSHIHRDIQKRLLELLARNTTTANQILLTTHNEALIRAADPTTLFHLEETDYRQETQSTKVYHPLGQAGSLPGVAPRFSGIYPAANRAVISSLSGDSTGLDFINAIEADHILFVEGQDDAQVFHWLLNQATEGRKKYAYWVLGGVSKVFDRLDHYRTVFSAIRNRQTLWEKSVLILDRDFLNDAHTLALPTIMQERMGIRTHCWDAYTFEATLLTDLPRLAMLLNRLLAAQGLTSQTVALQTALEQAYQNIIPALQERFSVSAIKEEAYRYRSVRDKIQSMTDRNLISEDDIDLVLLVQSHHATCFANGQQYKLMRKEEVAAVINTAFAQTGIPLTWEAEQDFLPTVQQTRNVSEWFPAWAFLRTV